MGSEVEGNAADRQVTSAAVYGSRAVRRRRRSNAELDDIDNAIIRAVERDHPVSLRGVYYRVVSIGAVEKTEAAYRVVGRQLLKLRRRGLIPYHHITDGTRWVVRPRTFGSLDEMLESAAASYRRAIWDDQEADVHVFTEKDAITGVIEPVTREWDVPLGVLRGYCSESFAAEMGEAINWHDGPVFVYNLGDHDPSGVDCWRDFRSKVTSFAPSADLTFERLAVTPEQIERLRLPTRPTKRSDSRSASFDGESVEVDAIPPGVLRQIVRDAIEQHVDQRRLELTRSVEQSERSVLQEIRGEYA